MCRAALLVLATSESEEIIPTWTCVAQAELASGRAAEAAVDAERELRKGEQRGVSSDKLAPVRYVLARALWESGGDRERARAEMSRARDDSKRPEDRRHAETWLREHAP